MHLSFCREVQKVAFMASIVAKPKTSGKEKYIIFVTPQWACSCYSLVCEGLSRHMARTRIAKAVGSTIARGIMKTRVQVMGEVITIL